MLCQCHKAPTKNQKHIKKSLFFNYLTSQIKERFMPTYIGEYNAGDFFRFPTSSDKKTEIKGDMKSKGTDLFMKQINSSSFFVPFFRTNHYSIGPTTSKSV
jgi:hypothetical protein